jgi:glyoxylase-like metal-dependent hydrolase (beta-lactamase superfamily II)
MQAMPRAPRVVPVTCPFGQAGGIVYVYYIDAPEPALVDTGVASSPATAIEPALNGLGLSLANVRWLLATHGHWDHIGGAQSARSSAAAGASLLLHANDAELLGSRRAHMKPDGYQGIRFQYIDDPQLLVQHDAMLMENLSGELIADRALNGGERISLGGDISFEVVHTPGHSPCSSTFVLDGLDWAFTGDSVQVSGTGGIPLFVDPDAYLASQQRLLTDVRPARVHLGHNFRRPDGTPLQNVLDGPAVEGALRESIAVHQRMASAADAVVDLNLEHPRAEALAPAAAALGLSTDPATWPPSIFATLHGYLARAATRG